MFGDMSPSARTRIQSSTDRGIGLTSTPMRKRSSPSKKASSSSRSPVFGDRSPVMCRELSPNAKGIGLTLLPKETRSSPCVRVETDAEFNAWCNGTLGSSNRHRKKASDMSQTEINQHMLNFTYVVMDALDIKSVLQNKKRSLKTNMDNDKVEDDPILGCLPLTTKEQYFDLEEKLKNDSFVKTWKMSLLEHTRHSR
ncbi:uncharacterized protein LOC136080487 [Hydra vulgaris]|uniref:Uncharacterized protein LOC136080487 n=1 Tax=Hydra vulgaris TaxID=6087 RepID=A0ABM4BVP5_HYDVU